MGNIFIFTQKLINMWLISVPTRRFVVVVADAPLSHRAELPGASDEPLGATDVFCAKAQCNVAAATGCWSRKALSQDVMFLAFVPLYARSRVSGQQVFFACKRSANEAAAEGFVCVKAQRQHRCWSRRRYHRM